MSESEESSYEASHQQSQTEEAPSFDRNRVSYSSKQINSKAQISSDEDLNCNEFLSRLQARIESIQIKLLNISNAIGLMQKYNEVRDVQFEKELQTAKYEGQAEAFQKWSYLVEKKMLDLDNFAKSFSDRLTRGPSSQQDMQASSFKFQSSPFRPSYCPCFESLPKIQKNVFEQFRVLHKRISSLECLCTSNYSASTDNYIQMTMGAAAKITLKESSETHAGRIMMKAAKSPKKKKDKIREPQSQREIADSRSKSKYSQKSSLVSKKAKH